MIQWKVIITAAAVPILSCRSLSESNATQPHLHVYHVPCYLNYGFLMTESRLLESSFRRLTTITNPALVSGILKSVEGASYDRNIEVQPTVDCRMILYMPSKPDDSLIVTIGSNLRMYTKTGSAPLDSAFISMLRHAFYSDCLEL